PTLSPLLQTCSRCFPSRGDSGCRAGTPGRRSAVERLAADKAKYVKSQRVSSGTKQEPAVPHSLPIARRSSAKRPIRPDSLVIYRQKCEFVRGQSHESLRGSLVRRLFPGSSKEKQLASESSKVILKEDVPPEAEGPVLVKNSSHNLDLQGQNAAPNTTPAAVLTSRCENAPKLTVAPYEVKEVRRQGLHRSQSDISSRYSKSFSEFDTFFKYCGLEPEVIEDLGQENFSVASDNFSFRIRSISVATSESDFTRHSGDDGLLEEELTEQVPSGTSVIERNARIIKWLYTCKKAKETNALPQEFE
uniref:Family with sequence similarity 110 member C n=1 Tax=Varanus komodoensis TaxID=61221 RepID=A0A8D2IZP4_VARKO